MQDNACQMGLYDFSGDETKDGIHVKRSDIAYAHMRDPKLLRYYYKAKTVSMLGGSDIEVSSPTDLFIGRYGYPKVFIGPMMPPQFGDTSLLGAPERWTDLSMEQIVDFRMRLVRGMHLSNVHDVEKGRYEEYVRDLALAEKPADAEMRFKGKPYVRMELRDEVQPYGPTVKMDDFKLYNFYADRKVESLYTDIDAKATTAVVELYKRGVPVSKIQKGLSAGLFGIEKNRRFVPTRWSITAVDDTIGKDNLRTVKHSDTLDATYLYYNDSLDNRWFILMMPGSWQYESIEAWYPGTVWNEDGKNVSIFGSYEGYTGRKTYAEIGGCYYAARLAVSEKLIRRGKQAMVLILRECHPGYTMPVGVWNVREHVREALRKDPIVMNSPDEAFGYMSKLLDIPVKAWIKNSHMLKDMLTQRRISQYVK